MRIQGQHFFDSLMLVLGIVLGAFIGLIFFVRLMFIDTQGQLAVEAPEVQEQIEQRIAPIGSNLLLGAAELEAAAAAAAAAAAPAQRDTVFTGPQVYDEACYLCHAAPGVGGAPVLGDADAWGPRIEQGLEILVQHVIDGYQGETGVMPPKGGRLDLSDAEIRSGVEYMVGQVTQAGDAAAETTADTAVAE